MLARRRLVVAAALFGAVATGPSVFPADEPSGDGPIVEEIADGVLAVLQPDAGRFDDSNAVVLINDRDVIVVDAQTDRASVARVIQEVRERTDKPIRYVINTHWHGDHTQGNQVYAESLGPEIQFVGHTSLIEDVPGRAEAAVRDRVERLDQVLPEAEKQLLEGRDEQGQPLDDERQALQAQGIERARRWLETNREARFLSPDVTFEDTLTFRRGSRVIRLMHFRGHTRGDTVVFLPREKILITGDLLDDLPYVGHGYPAEWVRTLRSLGELDFETIVPGHGPVFRGRTKHEQVLGYLADLVGQVEQAVAQGKDLDQTRAGLDLTVWRESLARDEAARRFFDAVLDEAVERAWSEARGELTD